MRSYPTREELLIHGKWMHGSPADRLTRAIGRRYGVNHTTILRLVHGKTWATSPAEAAA